MPKKTTNLYKFVYFIISVLFLIGFNLYNSAYLSAVSMNKTVSLFSGMNLNYMENTGAAFSILQNSKVFLITFSICAIILIIWYLIKNISELSMMAVFMVSLLLSGIGCNMYERITLGYVRDYFETTFFNFPVFNISDIFINISVVVIMYLLIMKNYSKK